MSLAEFEMEITSNMKWIEKPLADLIEPLISGSRPKGGVRGIESGVPSIGGEHLTADGGFNFARVKYVPHKFYESMRRGHIRRGDILIVKDGATTGKVALIREDFPFEEAVVNEHVFIVRPKSDHDSRYIFWYLYSQEGQERVLEHFQGAAQGGIGSLDWSNLKFADQDNEISSLILEPGDILFNRTNSPDLVGKTAVFRVGRTATFASYLIRLKVIPQLAVPEFVAYWINSAWGREWAQLAKTDGVSQSNINGTKLSVMPIPLPTVVEQAEIVRRVESLFALADSTESRLADATAQVERTTQAILAKALRGEL